MKVFCFLMRVPMPPRGASFTPVARLSLCREEAETHPLRISQIREIDIEPDPRLSDRQPIDIQPRPRAGAA